MAIFELSFEIGITQRRWTQWRDVNYSSSTTQCPSEQGRLVF